MRVRPTLVIGLGEQGRQVVEALQQRLQRVAPDLLEGPITFLHLDTHENGFPDLRPPHGTLRLTIDDTSHWTQPGQTHVRRWWPAELQRLDSVKAGVAGCRPYGRLAFFHHFEHLRDCFKVAHARIRDPQLEFSTASMVDLMQPTDVYLAAFAGGGTGGGMLLDLCFLLNLQFREHGINLQGFLLFPNSPDDGLAWANVYALLKEINHYSYGPYQYEAEWSEGQAYRVSLPPFDHCYLFQTPPQPGLDPVEVVAGAIMTELVEGEFSEFKRSLRVNLKQYTLRTFDVEHGDYAQQFICRYSSLGQAELQVPYERLLHLCRLRLAREAVRSWMAPPAADYAPVSALMSTLGLHTRQLRSAHGLIQSLVFGERPGEVLGKLGQWAQDWARQVESTVDPDYDVLEALERDTAELEGRYFSAELLEKRSRQLLSRAEEDMERHFSAQVEAVGLSSGQHEQTLKELTKALETAQDVLRSQTEWCSDLHRQRCSQALRLMSELRRLQTRHNWDRRKAALLARFLSSYFQATIDFGPSPGSLACQVRKQAGWGAMGLCRTLTQWVEETLRPRLESVRAALVQLEEELGQAYEAEMEPLRHHPDGIDWPRLLDKIYASFVTDEAVLHTRGRVTVRRGRGLLEGQLEPLREMLLEEAGKVFERVDLRFGPAHILARELKPEQRQQLLKRLVETSRPWVRGRRQNHLFQLEAHQSACLVGLPNLRKVATVDEREHYLETIAQLKSWIAELVTGPVSFSDLEGGDKLVVYHEVAGFPLNYLDGLEAAREQYLRHLMGGEPLHVNERVDPAVDLYVYSPTEFQALRQAMRGFVLACLFNLLEFREGYRRESWPVLPHRDPVLMFLAQEAGPRQRLLQEAEELLEALKNGPLERLTRLGVLVALQKRAVYGPHWGKVGGPGELPPFDRLEVSILSGLETELRDAPSVRQHSAEVILRAIDAVQDSLSAPQWLRDDGRYCLEARLAPY